MRALASILWLAGAIGCTDLGEYRGDFSGAVVGAVACADDGPCSFIRRGFRGDTVLQLEGFDPTIRFLDLSGGIAPGFLTTDDEHCGAGTTTFAREPLRPIPALAHDALSELEVPGSGRIKTHVYALEPSRGPLAGRDALVFVTLLENQAVEVRIVAGDGNEPDCAAMADDCAARSVGDCDFFGVFPLTQGGS